MSMSSNDTSSTSVEPNSRGPKTWEVLLETREGLLKLRELHRSSLWDSLKDLLWAERLFHSEALVETDDAGETRDHKFLLRWLRHFMEAVPELVEGHYQALESDLRGDNERPDPDTGGSPYMESDGGANEVEDVD